MPPVPVSKISASLLCAGLASFLFLQSSPAASSSPELSDGMRFYKKGQYINALASLNRAVALDDNNALAHYYLANTLLYVNQPDEAMEEYKVAYSLSPAHSQMSRYCMMALQAQEQKEAEEEGRRLNKQLLHQMVTQIQDQVSVHK